MTGRAHWSGALANWSTDNGKIHQNQLYGSSALIQFGDGNWTDFDVTFDYETGGSDVDGAWQDGRQSLQVWCKDANNYIDIALDGAIHRIMVSAVVSGSSVGSKEFDDIHGTAGGTGNVTFQTSGKLRVQMKSNRLKLWIDGTALAPAGTFVAPWDAWDVSSLIGAGNRQGKVGAAQNTYRWPVLSAIAVRALDIQCTSIDGAVGRKAYTGADASVGTVTYAGTYSGAPVTWVARLLDATDPDAAPLTDWVAASATTGGGSYSIAQDLPLGGPYIVEHGYLDGSGLRHTCFSPPTLVGYRIISYGQSTSGIRGGAGSQSFALQATGAVPASIYNSSSDYASGQMVNGRDPYVTLSTLQAWGFTNVATQIASAPIIFEAYGVGGATIGILVNGTSSWTAFAAALATRKGVIECMIWDQGQGDVDVDALSFASNYAAYPSAFTTGIVAPIRSLAGNASLPILVAHMARWGASAPPASLSTATHDSQRDAFRRMQYALTVEGGGADTNIHSVEHHTGVLYADNYHPTGVITGGIDRVNERSAWSVCKHALGLSVHSGRGPSPAGVTRSGAVISVAMTMNGASSLSQVTFDTRSGTSVYPSQPANRHKGWEFSLTSNFASLLAVSSSTVNGNSVDFTLASTPGSPVYVRHLYGANYDDSVLFHGVYSGSSYDHSIPVEPVMSSSGYLVSN
jgi:hypothetical protein